MSRDGSDVYSKPAGTTAVSGSTIESAKFNQVIDDLVNDANLARPIVAGGTGATTAEGARTNLGAVGLLSQAVVLTSGTAATYTVPSGVKKIDVEVVGGGGGGGATDGQGSGTTALGHPGTGAGYSRKLYSVSPGDTGTYTVGAAGAGGAAGANNGSNGGDTTFEIGGATITANGGVGGAGRLGTTSTTFGGGDGGAASAGDINIQGEGTPTVRTSSGVLYGFPVGGASVLGRGGAAPGANSDGADAPTAGYGGGGGGATSSSSSTNRAGGDGTPGVIIIREYK